MGFSMRLYANLLSLLMLLLAGCAEQSEVNYGFYIDRVTVGRAYRSLNISLQQELVLSQPAREALEHGVTLFIVLEMEIRNDSNMIVMRRNARYFELRYLPLSERYQLSEEASGDLQSFFRLRHMLAELNVMNFSLPTGPLAPGSYELSTRISLDENRLPAPMQLPVWFSSQWQHDSEWSVWPFTVSV